MTALPLETAPRNLSLRPRMRKSAVWTDERCERLRELVADGLSAGQIAHEIGGGISRCAVIGKCLRLGLQLHGSIPDGMRAAARGPKRRRPRIVLAPPVEAETAAAIESPPPPEPAPRPSRRLSLMDLDMVQDCRWVLNDPRAETALYCGAPRLYPGEDARSCYCRWHWQLSRRAVS